MSRNEILKEIFYCEEMANQQGYSDRQYFNRKARELRKELKSKELKLLFRMLLVGVGYLVMALSVFALMVLAIVALG